MIPDDTGAAGGMPYSVRQFIISLIGAAVAFAAIWGLDISWLNEPWVANIIIGISAAAFSFFVKVRHREPTLAESYHVVEKARQARETERWRQRDSPGSLRSDDGFQRQD